MAKINKNDLIKKVAYETKRPINEVRNDINIFLRLIQDSILEGKTVCLKGFITFQTYKAKGKVIRDFQKRKQKRIGPRTLPKAQFSKKFIQKVKTLD